MRHLNLPNLRSSKSPRATPLTKSRANSCSSRENVDEEDIQTSGSTTSSWPPYGMPLAHCQNTPDYSAKMVIIGNSGWLESPGGYLLTFLYFTVSAVSVDNSTINLLCRIRLL